MLFSFRCGVSVTPVQSYPYTAKDGTCKAKTSLEVAKISGYKWATKNKNESEMQVAVYNVAPLSICVDAITWQTYTSVCDLCAAVRV